MFGWAVPAAPRSDALAGGTSSVGDSAVSRDARSAAQARAATASHLRRRVGESDEMVGVMHTQTLVQGHRFGAIVWPYVAVHSIVA